MAELLTHSHLHRVLAVAAKRVRTAAAGTLARAVVEPVVVEVVVVGQAVVVGQGVAAQAVAEGNRGVMEATTIYRKISKRRRTGIFLLFLTPILTAASI